MVKRTEYSSSSFVKVTFSTKVGDFSVTHYYDGVAEISTPATTVDTKDMPLFMQAATMATVEAAQRDGVKFERTDR